MRIMYGKTIFMFLLLLLAQSVQSDPYDDVITGFNEQIQFGKITVDNINNSKNKAIEQLNTALDEIYKIPAGKRTFDNTARAFDNAVDVLLKPYLVANLMSNAHPDDAIRNASNNAVIEYGKYFNELNINEDLYKAFKEYSETKEAKSLTGYKEKYMRESIRDFERNGFALPKEKREHLKEINDRLDDLSNMFDRNIAEYNDSLIVAEDAVKGLDEAFKSTRRRADGTYKIDLSYPSYQPFMRLSESEEARKMLAFKYMNRAADKNPVVLEKVLLNRKEMVELLGYKTYSQYRLETRMAQNPETVWDFENGLIDKVTKKADQDYEEVLKIKRQKTGIDTASVIKVWEWSYYSNILKKEKYEVDSEKIKEYFALNNVLDGLFNITQTIFGIEYKEVQNASVWHEDVRLFEVFENNKLIGRFYLDLFPRDNKFKHAACFAIQKGRLTANGYQIPTAALECNFPKPTDDSPGLMQHETNGNVETFFHEFGHVLHNMLTTAELSSFSGTSVSRDFVEAPSQIFENWTWDYPSLQTFARHYKTGEVLPKELFEKMLAARNVGSGRATSYQIFYGMIDMTLHDKYNPNEVRTTTDVIKELQRKIILTPYMEGTHFEAAFGHLMGYASSYYGYLWSNVYAQDMFSEFEKGGILNPEVGKRYREIILSKGGTEEPIELVKQFLQREPNPEAFYRSLGLEPAFIEQNPADKAGK